MFSTQRRRPLPTITVFLLILLVLIFLATPHHRSYKLLHSLPGISKPTRRLHLLLPATASNVDFCKLLLSSTITGYPEPILIGWDGQGHLNGTQTHLFKVTETLVYLNGLPASNDDDLVLLLDAYDIWMLLRPEVILSRYFDIVKRSNQRLKEQGILGKNGGGDMVEDTIIWGADKVCWPTDERRPGCWAVPDSPMREKAFGPDTDTWMVPARPRWLNSGTAIGPVKHMRGLFDATLGMMDLKFNDSYTDRNSDQYYFTEVWGEQEIGRIKLRDGDVRAPLIQVGEEGKVVRGWSPDTSDGRRTEFHISLDYEVEIFQQAAAYTEYLTWMSFNHSTSVDLDALQRRPRLDEIQLPDDIARSKPPFEAMTERDVGKEWEDMVLGVNTAGLTTFPLLHMTGDKTYRDKWWHYAWFHPHAEQLLAASSGEDDIIAVVNGEVWKGADTGRLIDEDGRRGTGGGGAWTDRGRHLGWTELCGGWEKELFLQ